jgi:hypothetical protein
MIMENETDKVVHELCEWMKENSFDIKSNQKLELVNSANKFEGRCVLARREIGPDVQLVSMPFKFLINYKFALNQPDLVHFFEWYHSSDLLPANLENKLTRLDALYFVLIVSKYQPDSHLAKFVNSMPATYDTPEYFSSELIEQLPVYLKDDIVKRLSKFKSKFEFIKLLLTEYLCAANSNKTVKILSDNFKYDEFKWAFCSVNSRCFHIAEADICSQTEIGLAKKYFGQLASNCEDDSFFDDCQSLEDYNSRVDFKTQTSNSMCCVIPYLDFLNHSFEANTYAYFDKKKKAYILSTKSAEELFGSDESVLKPGDQVFITYGHHDNKSLLIDYGFVLDNSIYDRVIFKLEDFSQFISSENAVKSSILWRKALSEKLFNDLSCNKADGPSWNLLRLLDLIVYVNENEVASDMDLDAYDSYEIKYAEKVRGLLLILLESFVSDFDKAASRLKELKRADAQSYHIAMCLSQVQLDLEIVKFSVDLSNDEDRWISIF